MWPHEIKLTAQPNGGNNIAAQIKRVNSAGPFVRLDLARQSDGEVFTVELTKSRLIPSNWVF